MSTPSWGLLIVEDDPEIAYLLRAILDGPARTLHTAASGEAAIDIAQREPIDLIVLDLILPDVDGRALLTRFRSEPRTAGVPIIVVSARGGSDIRQDCYSLGADLYVEKPFDPDVVSTDVRTRLERSAARTRAAEVDEITGLPNRAGARARYQQDGASSALALIQLDGFLSVTERWGWDFGEEILRSVAGPMRDAMGEGGFLARLGAGEFILLSGRTDDPSAVERAERILDRLREVSIDAPDGETFRLTASIGVIDVTDGTTLNQALDEARVRLFRAQEAGRNQVVARDAAPGHTSGRVLIAEDDEISATILVHRLEKEGLDVVRVDNGSEVYQLALDDTPDLLILDVKMPGMDGFEVLERLRRTPSFSAVPIIMLTSMGSEADVVRGFQLGADDYVLKPFSPVELSARVWRLLRRGRSDVSA
ncbi:MAG: response regulator [Gemmatimonadota bacterium]